MYIIYIAAGGELSYGLGIFPLTRGDKASAPGLYPLSFGVGWAPYIIPTPDAFFDF